jgi:hypothetical protein
MYTCRIKTCRIKCVKGWTGGRIIESVYHHISRSCGGYGTGTVVADRKVNRESGKANWLVVSLTCDLARSSKCRRTCFASRSGQLSQGYNWRIWPTPRNRTEHNTRINTLV